jgi:hypothetical protein
MAFSMRVYELSLGYGKFEYKREGLTGQMASSHRCLDRECTPTIEFSLPLRDSTHNTEQLRRLKQCLELQKASALWTLDSTRLGDLHSCVEMDDTVCLI